MVASLGTIRGQMVLDVKQALNSYTKARLAHLQTVTALKTGGGALTAAGAGVAAMGAGMLAGLMGAANAAAEFERRLDFAGAVTNATASEMEALRTSALQLGKDTIYSANEIADSFVELAKAGVSVKDIIGGVGQAVANLGAAADIPLDTAANIIMAAVQTFRLSAEDAVKVADLLAGAANASIVEVQDLGVSLKYAGGVAASLRIPMADLVDAISLLGTYGIKGSTAGTNLRQILVSLTGTSKAAREELMNLGIITRDGGNKFYDATGKLKPLAQVFQILQDATKNLSDEQRIEAFRTIFQSRALAGVLDLSKEGAAGFAKMHAEIGKTTAMDVASKRLNNLSGDIEILKGNLETLAISSGSYLQTFLRGIVQNLTQAVQWFSNLGEGTQKFLVISTAVVGSLLVFIGALGMLAGAVLNIVGAIMTLGPAFGLLSKGIGAAVTAFSSFGAALLANPITWIVLAIIALVAAFVILWKKCDAFRNFWIGLWNKIVSAFKATINWFKSIPAWWSSFWQGFKDTVSNIWNGILNFFKSIPGLILSYFYNFTLPGLLIKHWDSIWATIQTVWNGILNFFAQLPGRIASFFAQLPGLLGYWLGYALGTVARIWIEIGSAILTAAAAIIEGTVSFFAQLPGRVAAFVSQLYNDVVNWFQRIWAQATAKAAAIVNGIVNFFQQLPGRVASFFSNMYSSVVNWLQNTYASAVNKASAIVSGIVSFFTQLPGRVATFFGQVFTTIATKLSQAKDKAVELGTSIANGLIDTIKGLPDLVTGIFGKIVSAIKDKIKDAFSAVKNFASSMWEGFKDGIGMHSPSHFERAMWQITGTIGEETKRMRSQVRVMQGLGKHLTDINDNLGTDMGANLVDAVRTVKDQVTTIMGYQRKLDTLAASTVVTASTQLNTKMVAPPQPVITIEKGDTIDLDVTWNAADNDHVDTAKQLKDMLGRSKNVLSGVDD